jgi:hypothetical protein
MAEPRARALREACGHEIVTVDSATAFLAAPRDSGTVSFLDDNGLAELDRAAAERRIEVDQLAPQSVIAVCDDTLQTAINWLPSRPWLAHVISMPLLTHPLASEHLKNVTTTLRGVSQPRLLDWLGPDVTGRRVRLAHAHKRVERLERMSDYLSSKGTGSRTIQMIRDAAEELLTNAFYDAPVAAGAVKNAISRTQDVALPDDSACDMVYGCREDLAIVRVRDPFGSLTRLRLVEVLTRCARTDMQVEVDETMGGAGLGLWRIFSVATFVAVSVVNNRHTEFLVGIGKRTSGPRPFAFHLFFKDRGGAVRRWKLLDHESTKPTISNSITIVNK